MARYRGESSENVPIRPLDKGMFRDRQTQIIPKGGFYTIKNFVAGKEGLRRIGSFGLYAGDVTLEGEFIDMVTLWTTADAQYTFLITSKYLYRVNALTGYVPIYWSIDDHSMSNSGNTVYTTSSNLEKEFLQEDHIFQVAPTNDRVYVETTRDTGGDLAGKYFRIDDAYYVWYEVSGSGSDPGQSGTGIKVAISTDDDGAVVASETATAVDGNSNYDAVNYDSESKLSIRRTTSYDMSDAGAGDSGFNVVHWDEISDYGSEYSIESWTDSSIVLKSSPGSDYPKLTNFRVIRTFNPKKPYLVDHEIVRNELVLACMRTPLLVYNPSTEKLERYISDSADMIRQDLGGIEFQCESITYYKGRVYVGHTYDSSDLEKKQRIRWSKATNPRDFSDIAGVEQFQDLPEVGGSLKRLVPMGNILVAYFEDGVFFGTSSNITNLPLTFQQVQTGGNGLVGQKAVTSWLNGHYYVSQDDIYFISNSGPKRIGSPVVDDTIAATTELWRTYVIMDPRNYRVLFGFPEGGLERIAKIWSYEYRSEAWSYTQMYEDDDTSVLKGTDMIANPLVNYELSWNDLTPDWDDLTYGWDDLESSENLRKVYVEHNNVLYVQTGVEGNLFGEPTEAVIETGDLDLEGPDMNKTAIRLSMKISSDYGYGELREFDVKGSTDRGRTWKPLGTLRIRPTYDEGYVNFRLTGSTLRFRLTSTSDVEQYTVTEMVLRVVPRGMEQGLGVQE